jgi:hypothetical protein
LDGGRVCGELVAFLSAFTPWEAEEIGCVHEYIVERLDQVVEGVEKEFIQSVAHADHKVEHDEAIAQQASEGPEARSKGISRILLPDAPEDSHCLGWSQSLFDDDGPEYHFSTEAQRYHKPQMEALASLGAPLLRTFLESSNKTKLALILQHPDTRSYNFDDALSNSFPPCRLLMMQRIPELATRMLSFNEDWAHRANQGWVWAKENNLEDNFIYFAIVT